MCLDTPCEFSHVGHEVDRPAGQLDASCTGDEEREDGAGYQQTLDSHSHCALTQEELSMLMQSIQRLDEKFESTATDISRMRVRDEREAGRPRRDVTSTLSDRDSGEDG